MRLTETVRSGRVVADRYELLSPIGSGAMGVVWRANDPRLNRIVAIKLLRLPRAATPDEARRARQRVFREARIAARLQHPHAVAIYDIVTDHDGQPALVMEYVPSQELASLIVEHGTLPPGAAARVGAETASALAAAHAAGIVHRDVKPGNVLLARAGGTTTDAAKITDVGLARATDDVTVTETGLLLGTPAFLAPETARGEPPTPASDVFSLGATLYAAVESTPPLGSADNPITQLHLTAAGRVRPPRHTGPLTPLLLEMLRNNPTSRPSMTHVAHTLTTESTPTWPAPRPLPDPTPRVRTRKHPRYARLAALTAGLLLLLIATLPTSSTPNSDTPPTPTPTAQLTPR